MTALVEIPVGVVVARRKAASPWIEHTWQPISILLGQPATAPWTPLSDDGTTATFYAGATTLALHASDTGNYRDNLLGDSRLWVVLTPTESDPPYSLFMVTADPTEGEAQTETGVNLVEAVAMPDAVRAVLDTFVAEHHVEQTFYKRKRDRANPEALGRRAPSDRDRDDD